MDVEAIKQGTLLDIKVGSTEVNVNTTLVLEVDATTAEINVNTTLLDINVSTTEIDVDAALVVIQCRYLLESLAH